MARRGRFGLVAYARILAAVTGTARSPRDVALSLDAGENSVREVLWGMVKLGLVHVQTWVPPQVPRSSFWVPLMLAGEGASVPYPVPIKRSAGGATGWARPELTHFATIVRELRHGATRAEIIERCGTMHHNLTPLLRAMQTMGLAHVAAWLPSTSGKPSQVWQLGEGRSAPRPRPMPHAERQLRYRQARRARRATLQVVHAVAGDRAMPKYGVQAYHLLGGKAA